jgi:hypothetical protein
MLGWHFSNSNKKLQYGDGRVIKAGITHSVSLVGPNNVGSTEAPVQSDHGYDPQGHRAIT